MKRAAAIAIFVGVCLLFLVPIGYEHADQYLQKQIETRVAAQVDARVATTVTDSTKALQDQISALDERITLLKGELDFFESVVEEVHSDEASVSTDGNGYGVIQTQQGAFLVVARSATPYLDGYKIRLEIGNMTTATIEGAKITVEWGLTYGDKAATPQQVAASRHKKVFDVTTTFTPGGYSATEVFLSPAKPAEVKGIQVGLAFNTIVLRKPMN